MAFGGKDVANDGWTMDCLLMLVCIGAPLLHSHFGMVAQTEARAEHRWAMGAP